MATDGRNT